MEPATTPTVPGPFGYAITKAQARALEVQRAQAELAAAVSRARLAGLELLEVSDLPSVVGRADLEQLREQCRELGLELAKLADGDEQQR